MQKWEFVTIMYTPARKPKDLEIFWVLYNNLVSLCFSLDTVFIQTCHQARAGDSGGLSQGLVTPRAIGCIRSQAFFRRLFFDWNTHFVVFSGGVEQGLGGPTARSSLKIRQNGGWEARRFFPTGIPTWSYFPAHPTGAWRPDGPI